jgi:hypothetical protein
VIDWVPGSNPAVLKPEPLEVIGPIDAPHR